MKKENKQEKKFYIQLGMKVNGRIKHALNMSLEDMPQARVSVRNFKKPSFFKRVFQWDKVADDIENDFFIFNNKINEKNIKMLKQLIELDNAKDLLKVAKKAADKIAKSINKK